MELRISRERIDNIQKELLSWANRRKGTKRELLSLLGKLVFVSRVTPAGRVFTRRIIECSKVLKHLHHRTRLSTAAQKDITWWIKFMEQWNSKSLFFDKEWLNAHELGFYTDASGSVYGAVCGTNYIQDVFNETQRDKSIDWQELYAIVVACQTWSSTLSCKRLIIHCDNTTEVQAVNNGSSKSVD